MAQETIFSKIIRKEIPANIVYQDELVTAFRDISPQAETHILIIPNKVIPTVNDVTEQDEVTLGRLFTVAAKIAKEEVPDIGLIIIIGNTWIGIFIKSKNGSNMLMIMFNNPLFKNIFIPNIIAKRQGKIFKIIPNDSVEPVKNSS